MLSKTLLRACNFSLIFTAALVRCHYLVGNPLCSLVFGVNLDKPFWLLYLLTLSQLVLILALTLPPLGKLCIFACLLGFAGEASSLSCPDALLKFHGRMSSWLVHLAFRWCDVEVKSSITPTLPSTRAQTLS